MKQYKKEFIEFLIENKSLKFGEFTLKSGRISPYFLNTGMLYSGKAMANLGKFYAETVVDNFKDHSFDVLFGPAYKGIPLSIATVTALVHHYDINVNYSFNRKEIKDHGDGGILVGKKITSTDRIIIVDDVITAGTAVRESLSLLNKLSGQVSGIVISVDRMEKGKDGEFSAIQEISNQFGIKVFSIVNIIEIIEYLQAQDDLGDLGNKQALISKMEDYRSQYGVGS